MKIFISPAFSMAALTAAINILPNRWASGRWGCSSPARQALRSSWRR